MTTIEQINKLIDAGYTKTDIDNLMSGQYMVSNVTPDTVDETTTPTETQVTTTEDEQGLNETPQTAPTDDSLDDTKQTLAELTKTVEALVKAEQARNRANYSNTARVMNTTDDIITSLINPTENGGKN